MYFKDGLHLLYARSGVLSSFAIYMCMQFKNAQSILPQSVNKMLQGKNRGLAVCIS